MPTEQSKELFDNLKKRFANPPWISEVAKTRNQVFLWILLTTLLIQYFFDWGLSTERAYQCLISGHTPQGRWIDEIAGWPWMSPLTITLSLVAIFLLSGRATVKIPGSKSEWHESSLVGLVWAIPLLITRVVSEYLPESPCRAANADPKPLFSLGQLNGPSEEVWFAATIATWILITQKNLYARVAGVAFGCMILRGIFHVYQGWESIGLFIWGAVAGAAIALTGRWVIMFVLHFINNSLITAFDFDSLSTAFFIFLACMAWYFFTIDSSKGNALNSSRYGVDKERK